VNREKSTFEMKFPAETVERVTLSVEAVRREELASIKMAPYLLIISK
jgi:hypothetical protein